MISHKAAQTLERLFGGELRTLCFDGTAGNRSLFDISPPVLTGGHYEYILKGLILAQNERWRRGLGMQVERIPGSNIRGKWRKGQ